MRLNGYFGGRNVVPDPCKGCQSFGKCSGSCWVTELRDSYRKLDEEMATPEGQEFYKNVLDSCEPVARLAEWHTGPWGRG